MALQTLFLAATVFISQGAPTNDLTEIPQPLFSMGFQPFFAPHGGVGLGGLFGNGLLGGLAQIPRFNDGGQWSQHNSPTKIVIQGTVPEDIHADAVRVTADGKDLVVSIEQSSSEEAEDEKKGSVVGRESDKHIKRTFELPFEAHPESIKKTTDGHRVTLEIPVPPGVTVAEGDALPLASASSFSFSSTKGFKDDKGETHQLPKTFASVKTFSSGGPGSRLTLPPLLGPLLNGLFRPVGPDPFAVPALEEAATDGAAYAHDAGARGKLSRAEAAASPGVLLQQPLAALHRSLFSPFAPLMAPGMFPSMQLGLGPLAGGEFGGFETRSRLGEWTEKDSPQEIVIKGVLPDAASLGKVEASVSGATVTIRESAAAHKKTAKGFASAREREVRMFDLPFEVPANSVKKAVDAATHTITLTIPVPAGVAVPAEDERPLGVAPGLADDDDSDATAAEEVSKA